jgi:hypothetical protein
VRAVESWARRYTRRVDPRLAERREAEVAFELWEFEMARDRYRWSGPRSGLALVFRTLRGMPRDLSWRRVALQDGLPQYAPVTLLSRRRRPRVWIPLQLGHTFDQTNGAIEPERAMPYNGPHGSLGAAGNAFGMQGGF